MGQEARLEVGEIAIRVARRRHALVNLKDMDGRPRDLLVGKEGKHHPRSAPPAHREAEPSARCGGFPGRLRDDRCCALRYGRNVIEDLDLHGRPDTVGLLHPPGGATRWSVSLGPHAPGS